MFMLNELLIKELSNQVETNASDIQKINDAEVYSTNEIKTNKIWIDGKPIYRKVFDLGIIPSDGAMTYSTNLNNVSIKKIDGYVYDSSDTVVQPINYISQSSTSIIETITINNGSQIRLRTKGPFTNIKAYVVLEYTKSN